jgi:hypothetical protein
MERTEVTTWHALCMCRIADLSGPVTWRLHVERALTWHHADVDNAHVERIAIMGSNFLRMVDN